MKKITKILSLGVLLLLSCTTQLSAQKCKFDYNKKDQLTGESSKGTTFSIKLWWKLGFNRVGDTYYVGMYININGNVRDIITPENTLIFKLSNGEIVTLHANDNFVPTAQVNQAQNAVVSAYHAKYDISAEDFQKLAASPLVYVKMGIGSARNYDSEFNAKKGEEFQNKAKCIIY
jgi:hypothetical protein